MTYYILLNIVKSECIEVVNYLTCGDMKDKKIKAINDARNLLVQAESLHYIKDTNKFDIVVIDEIESVLNGWISSTHDKNIAGNWFVFTNLLKNARRVILLDAFLTTKVKRLLNTLDIQDIKIYTSNKLPPQLIIKTSNSYDESIKNIANDLDAGRKCFVFHAFKTGNAKHLSVEALKCRLVDLCKNKIKVLVYSGDSDDKTKADLFNVNNAWAEADCIITTTAITVGVNYEGADYYKRYLFISGLCNNVRDVIKPNNVMLITA